MSYDPEQITFFAKTDARGQNVPFGIKAKDRSRHVYVIGKTGMGKSTMLENMVVQDIQRGEGVAFIDPHGTTAEKLLDYIPESRKDDVLYFAPFDMEHPVSFNVMEDVGIDKRHLVVSGLMSVFEKIWVDAWSARMAYILQNTLMALLEYPGSTLLGVNRMLSDKEYRKIVVENIQDPSVKSFWVDEFAKYNERYMQEAGDAIKNKIGQFTANPLIRNIIGQPKSSFDMRQIIDEKKILIMNLSKGLVGESNANLLGSMLTTRIYLAAMSRADCTPEEMKKTPDFYFYIDEFQSFANATFANILSESRKYKLNLTIAHQYITQMEEEVRDAIFGNVGTIISFRVGPFDAEVLETIFNPQFYATDICNLGFAQVYLTLMIDGIGSPPFSAVTLPPIEPAEVSYKDCILDASRKNFAHTRAEVERKVQEFHQPVKKSDSRQDNTSLKIDSKQESTHRSYNGEKNQNQNGWSEQKSKNVSSRRQKDDDVSRRHSSGNGQTHIRENTKEDNSNKKNKNLGDLRTVLQSISKDNNGDKNDTEKKNSDRKIDHGKSGNKSGKQNEQQKQSDSSTDLKDALTDVLKVGAKTAGIATTSNNQSHTRLNQPEPEQTSELLSTQTHQNEQYDVNLTTPITDNDTSQVTAKELERMMKVSENEKPPYKL